MSRPTTITDEQILDAARTLFLEEGFGVQTAKVARRAGVSEGTIFKRFQTKEGLFLAALDIRSAPSSAWHTEAYVGTGEVKDNLVLIMGKMLVFMQETVPRLFALIGHPAAKENNENHDFMDGMRTQDVKAIDTYLKGEMEWGRLRRGDTTFLTQVILGALIDYTIRNTFHRKSVKPVSPEERQAFVQNLADLLWDGIAPPPA